VHISRPQPWKDHRCRRQQPFTSFRFRRFGPGCEAKICEIDTVRGEFGKDFRPLVAVIELDGSRKIGIPQVAVQIAHLNTLTGQVEPAGQLEAGRLRQGKAGQCAQRGQVRTG